MKKIIFATGLLALMAAATSCDKYDIYPEQYEGVFTVRDAGTREIPVYTTDELAQVPFVIMKGGYDADLGASVTLRVMDDAEFASYVSTSGNSFYAPIPRDCYSFDKSGNVYSVNHAFAGGADDHYSTSTLYLRPQKLKVWLDANAAELEGKTPVVPVILVSADCKVDDEGAVTMVVPDVHIPQVTLDVEGVVARTVNKANMSEGDNFYRPETNFSIPCENPWGFTLNLTTSDQAVADYNAQNGTSYSVLEPSMYTLEKHCHFAAGTTYMPLDLNIDLNKLMPMKTYALAVTFDDPAITWDNASYNPGSSLGINMGIVMIYTIRVSDAVILEKVPLTADMVTSIDAETTEGSIGALFDDNPGTYYHSAWSRTVARQAPYGSYLEITLPRPMSMFRFVLANRESPTVAGYAKRVLLFGTNDLNNWPTTPFAEINNMTDVLNGSGAEGSFGTDEEPFTNGTDYKYLRFSVVESGAGADLNNPSDGNTYWCASKLELYGY